MDEEVEEQEHAESRSGPWGKSEEGLEFWAMNAESGRCGPRRLTFAAALLDAKASEFDSIAWGARKEPDEEKEDARAWDAEKGVMWPPW